MRAILGNRSLFPRLASRVYLNHAAVSPPSEAVRMAVCAALDDYGASGAAAWLRWSEQRNRLRSRFCRLFGVAEGSIALVPSTSQGLSDLALCLPWKAGDAIVLFSGEFPSNISPWQQAAAQFDLRIHWLRADDFSGPSGMEQLETLLRQGIRLIAVSAVQFQTGLRMPVEAVGELAHRYGAELAVDGIQALGSTPLDFDTIDYLVAGSHKWLMGPEGCALVYVRPGLQLVPRVVGWMSHENAAQFLFEPGQLRYDRPYKEGATVLEVGAYNTLGYAGWEAAVALIEELGIPAISQHIQGLNDRLEEGMLELGFRSRRVPQARSGILSLHPPKGMEVGPIWKALNSAGIACSMPDGLLRFSPHWPNDSEQIAETLLVARQCLACL